MSTQQQPPRQQQRTLANAPHHIDWGAVGVVSASALIVVGFVCFLLLGRPKKNHKPAPEIATTRPTPHAAPSPSGKLSPVPVPASVEPVQITITQNMTIAELREHSKATDAYSKSLHQLLKHHDEQLAQEEADRKKQEQAKRDREATARKARQERIKRLEAALAQEKGKGKG